MSRKFLVTVILILFLLPFVSWYYLQSGLDWRKKAQEVMSGTMPFPSGQVMLADGRKFSADSLEDRVSILTFLSCGEVDAEQNSVLQAVYDQFKETNKAVFILLDTCNAAAALSTGQSLKNWFIIPCADSLEVCRSISMNWEKDKLFALIDRKGVIRSYYGIATAAEKRILVEHMSLLLPRERQEKVELKRGDKK